MRDPGWGPVGEGVLAMMMECKSREKVKGLQGCLGSRLRGPGMLGQGVRVVWGQ